jgi:NAD(P)-dependent dehydrogenase (short-subunit alcohol dehydrogenase family)
MYSASKHAIKGFTDSLRMELEADEIPISVTLIKPTAIHTPFPENAKNFLPYEPQLPQPLYAPELVAEAIIYCSENPQRDFYVGEMAKLHSTAASIAPRLTDTYLETSIDSMQKFRRAGKDGPAGWPVYAEFAAPGARLCGPLRSRRKPVPAGEGPSASDGRASARRRSGGGGLDRIPQDPLGRFAKIRETATQ